MFYFFSCYLGEEIEEEELRILRNILKHTNHYFISMEKEEEGEAPPSQELPPSPRVESPPQELHPSAQVESPRHARSHLLEKESIPAMAVEELDLLMPPPPLPQSMGASLEK